MGDIVPIKAITKEDPRFKTLVRGFNQRWPAKEEQSPKNIYIVKSAEEAQEALQAVLSAKLRPTIRSGGHCYEDFVANNPGGAIIDVGLMAGIEKDPRIDPSLKTTRSYRYRVWAGSQNWDGALALYKLDNKCLPGGSCYSVGAGGHISGGGYGLLSRMHGLTVDWVAGVDILVADKKDGEGKPIVRLVHANKDQNADLFKACRGAGGGSYGLITAFYFDDLPEPPRHVALVMLQFPWSQFVKNPNDKTKRDEEAKNFLKFLNKYAAYFKDSDTVEASYGLFSFLKLTPYVTKKIGLTIQYCDESRQVKDIAQLKKFIEDMTSGYEFDHLDDAMPTAQIPFIWPDKDEKLKNIPKGSVVLDWLYATQSLNPSGNNQRGKYKSSYMKDLFTIDEAKALLEHLVYDETAQTDPDFVQSRVSIDSYGGAVNHKYKGNPHFDPAANQTSVPQRSSILKLQYQTYWMDPDNDKKHLDWMRGLYTAVHQKDGFNGTPYPGARYEGCYINYPDIDMLDGEKKGATDTQGHPYDWGTLYYGEKLFSELKTTKGSYDPYNVFHHAMSIPLGKAPGGKG